MRRQYSWVAFFALEGKGSSDYAFGVEVTGPPDPDATIEEWLEDQRIAACDPEGPGGLIHTPPVDRIKAITLKRIAKPAPPPPINQKSSAQQLTRDIFRRKAEEAWEEVERDIPRAPGEQEDALSEALEEMRKEFEDLDGEA